MIGEEYANMQEHLLYITELRVKEMDIISLKKVRAVMAFWNKFENIAEISFYYDKEASEDEIEDYSITNSEIIAHCSNAGLEEKFIRWDYPKPLPEQYLAYKRKE